MKKIDLMLLILIVIIAAFLRLYQLGQVPVSPNWDEVALGYNAYSILETGRDEYGKFLPILLQSYDDYKPALYTYLVVPFVNLLGLNVVAVRIVSALAGIATIFAAFFLVKEMFNRRDIAFTSSLLLAISPWHIHFSRVAYEANVGLFLNVVALLFFFKGLKSAKYLIVSAAIASLSLYVYQAEKLFVPLLALSLVFIFRDKLRQLSKKDLFTPVVVGLLFSLPFLLNIVSNREGLARAKSASILSAPVPLINLDLAKRNLVDRENKDLFGLIVDNRRAVYAKDIINHYLSHYDINWLFIEGESTNPLNPPLRRQTIGMGNLYLIELPLLLVGIYFFAFGKFDPRIKKLLLAWILIVPIPAAITWDTPNSIRTLNFLPVFQILVAVGIIELLTRLAKFKLKYLIIVPAAALCLFNFIYFLDLYFIQYNYFASKDWQYGYEQIVPRVEELKQKYEKVVVSNQLPLDQSHMFFLFYTKYPPEKYQKEGNKSGQYGTDHKFDKYEFVFRKWDSAQLEERVLYVLNPKEIDMVGSQNIVKISEVYFKDGSLMAVIFEKRTVLSNL